MRPGSNVRAAFIIWVGISVIVIFLPISMYLWWFIAVSLPLLICIDMFRNGKVKFEVERIVQNPLPVGVWSSVKLMIRYEGPISVKIDLYDLYPERVEVKDLPRTLVFNNSGMATLEYRIRPLERGSAKFDLTQLIIKGSLGFADRSLKVGQKTQIKVCPNFRTVVGYAMLAAENRVSQMGILKKRRRGEGLDFHQLRPYRVGDSLRQIDWKATSRMRRLVSKEYQEEKDQQVVFLLDCGRRMLAKDGKLSHFDHTIDSLLLTTYVALRQGDSVGLMTFSGEENRWLAPRKGEHRLNEMMNMIYDLQPSSQGSDYSTAAMQLMATLKKRALVVILSNLRDEDDDDIVPAVHLLKKNHLVLFASLQEVDVNRVLEKEIEDGETALTLAATHLYLENRRKAHEDLSRRNVVLVDVEPSELPIALVNRYLEIKSSQVL